MEIKQLVVGPLLTNCYLASSEGEILIIDPGGDIQKILMEIKKILIDTKDIKEADTKETLIDAKDIEDIKGKVKYVVNTHYHIDHTSGNAAIKKATGAKILIHEAEKDFIKFRPDRFLKDGEEIKAGDSLLKVILTPGHTKGSICLKGEDFIFTGDTLFKDGYGRTDLPGGNEEEMEESLERLGKIIKKGDMVYPGHGDVFKYLISNY